MAEFTVSNMVARHSILMLFVFGLLLMGCGGPPKANLMLNEARHLFEEAENDPLVVANAPVALEEAEEDLQRSLKAAMGERECWLKAALRWASVRSAGWRASTLGGLQHGASAVRMLLWAF